MNRADIQNATIQTAGAYVCVDDTYAFAMGTYSHNGRIPVFRLGGHREAQETGWQCAFREIFEETGLQIQPTSPGSTYLLPDGDHPAAKLLRIRWQPETEQEPAPQLVVAYQRAGKMVLSIMYLARMHGVPRPSSEIKGLLLLKKEEIHRLCREPITFEQYLHSGGKAILNQAFDKNLVFEPFLQLRLLSKILSIESPAGSHMNADRSDTANEAA